MALSRKPTKKEIAVQEDKVTELILKGGSSPHEPIKEIVSDKEEVIKLVQLRIPLNLLEDIDNLVKKRAGKLSRHTWIMEAIAKKLDDDK